MILFIVYLSFLFILKAELSQEEDKLKEIMAGKCLWLPLLCLPESFFPTSVMTMIRS